MTRVVPIGLVVLAAALLAPGARGQVAVFEESSPANLALELRRLGTTASVLHVVAHPDDEDAGTLAFLARGLGVRTMVLSLTRGEGGANLISPFFFDALGVLRTLEFLTACRTYGAELFFTRAADYGYSKRLDEAMRQWNGAEAILDDMVRVIRRERPDVIVSRFRGDARDGHGHHTLAGILARQAYEAAADPDRFPAHLDEGLEPWQVRKLYTNNLSPRRRPADRDLWTVRVDSGLFEPLLGCSWYQVGRFGYGFHRSQGIMNHAGASGPRLAYYRLAHAAIPGYSATRETSFFDGLDTSLAGHASAASPAWLAPLLGAVEKEVAAAAAGVDFRAPAGIAGHLVAGLKSLRTLEARVAGASAFERRDDLLRTLARKETEFQRALARALGLGLEVSAQRETLTSSSPFSRSTSFEHVVPGADFAVHLRLVHRSRETVKVLAAGLKPEWGSASRSHRPGSPLLYNTTYDAEFAVSVPLDAAPGRPHWGRRSIHEPFYDWRDEAHRTLPLPPPPLWGRVVLEYEGETIELSAPVRLTLRDLDHGTRHPPLAVAPALSVRFAEAYGVLPLDRGEYPVRVIVRSSSGAGVNGVLRLELPPGWSSEPQSRPFAFTREGDEASFSFALRPPRQLEAKPYMIRALARLGEQDHSEGFVTVSARDVGRFDLYSSALHTVRGVDVRLAGSPSVGYIMGSGDDVPAALGFLGVRPLLLERGEVETADLSRFDVILVGVRAYAVRSDIKAHNARLLDYVKNGGVLIVQYQTPEFDHDFGPFPYTMDNPEEVSEEDAAVTILEPDHPLFTFPNRISTADFDGWVEQRGSKFWRTWDARYTPLLECHDTGEEPQKGGMLVARHGRGIYVYSAYSWYRQLPHGVPGAFRIVANLLSLPAAPRRE